MSSSVEPIIQRCRSLIGRARLIYWDDPRATGWLHALTALVDAAPADHLSETATRALAEIGDLVVGTPRRGAASLLWEADEILLAAPEPREDAARRTLGEPVAGLDDGLRSAALAVLDAASEPYDVTRPSRITVDAVGELARWRGLASDLTLPRATRELATTVGRAAERLLDAEPNGPRLPET